MASTRYHYQREDVFLDAKEKTKEEERSGGEDSHHHSGPSRKKEQTSRHHHRLQKLGGELRLYSYTKENDSLYI